MQPAESTKGVGIAVLPCKFVTRVTASLDQSDRYRSIVRFTFQHDGEQGQDEQGLCCKDNFL